MHLRRLEPAGGRMRKIEADVSNINAFTTQQLDVLQSKLLDVETRIINVERPWAIASIYGRRRQNELAHVRNWKRPHRTLAYIT